jgi:CDP-diacylglycerol--serine O-phosphatidyltransferase
LNLICVGTDKLDGLAAKLLDARSDFGVQLDSLADLVSFGVAPAALYVSFYSHFGVFVLCAIWLCAAAIRLARFNVSAPAPFYRGTPSTMAAGMALTALLVGDKYHRSEFVPVVLVLGAIGMLSPLKVPKLGRTKHLVTTILVAALALTGVAFGLLRIYPEYLFGGGLLWLIVSFVFTARREPPPSAT